MTRFKVGSVYHLRFVSDYSLRVEYKCIKRTKKYVTFKGINGETISRLIREFNGHEYIVHGNYSMPPSIRATDLVENPNMINRHG